jgi:hypothetical protein
MPLGGEILECCGGVHLVPHFLSNGHGEKGGWVGEGACTKVVFWENFWGSVQILEIFSPMGQSKWLIANNNNNNNNKLNFGIHHLTTN